jgi:hypothetical protein
MITPTLLRHHWTADCPDPAAVLPALLMLVFARASVIEENPIDLTGARTEAGEAAVQRGVLIGLLE